MVVLNPFATSSDESESVLVTDDPREFRRLVKEYGSDPGFVGTIVITDGQDPGSGSGGARAPTPVMIPPVAIVPVTVEVTVYDWVTLREWQDTGFIPAFMEQVEVDEIPLEEAVFDLDFQVTESNGVITTGKLRVRKPDGAIAVVSITPSEGSSPGMRSMLETAGIECDAGWGWNVGHLCCHVQGALCRAVNFLCPRCCQGCSQCFNQCICCTGDNPCHSCDPCGFSWFLCRWFGSC